MALTILALVCCRHRHALAKASMNKLSSWRGLGVGIEEGVGRCVLVAAFIGCSFKLLNNRKVAGCRKVKKIVSS